MKKFTFFIVIFICLTSNAQWSNNTSENLLVVNDTSDDTNSVVTTNGETYIVYWKVVPAPTNYELRMQVLDVLGNKQLGDEGVLVSDTIPMASFTLTWKLAIDANNNLLIGVTGSGNFQGYSFKLDIDGNHLWNANGINTNDVGFSVTFLPLTNGETIITWDADDKALMQKYDINGNPIWSTPQPVVLGSSKTSPANLYELTTGDFINIFHEKSGSGIASTLYAQRYDTNGVAQWATAVQLSNNSTVFNRLYSGTQDGDVIYLGYLSSASNRFDSYLQRINPDGTLPWGINGIDFDTNQTNFEQDTQVAFFEGSQFIWSICTYTNTSQSESGEYVQKFDKETGARQFTDNAKELFPISTNFISHTSSLYLVNDHPVFLIKDGFSLKTVLLNENGNFIWPEETKPVATFGETKSRVTLNMPINGQLVTTFVENKIGSDQIFAQNFIDDELLSVSEFSTNLVQFENPITTNLVIKSDAIIKTVNIYTTLGRLVAQYNYVNNTNITINTELWKSGLYLMVLSTENKTIISKKIIKN